MALLERLASEGWNAARAAAAMGIGRSTLFRRLKSFGISIQATRESYQSPIDSDLDEARADLAGSQPKVGS